MTYHLYGSERKPFLSLIEKATEIFRVIWSGNIQYSIHISRVYVKIFEFSENVNWTVKNLSLPFAKTALIVGARLHKPPAQSDDIFRQQTSVPIEK